MTQPTLAFTAPDTFTEAVAELFQSRPNTWIDARELMAVGGMYAWRTRCSECRKRGLRIENAWHTVEQDGRKFRVSRYRLVTQEAA